MSQDNTPQNNTNNVQNSSLDENQAATNTPEEAYIAATTAGAAWYARPWFWAILTFLLLIGFLAWLFWKQWQANLAVEQEYNALLQEQLAKNSGIEAEIQRLRDILKLDPCIIKELLAKDASILPLDIQTEPQTSQETNPLPSTVPAIKPTEKDEPKQNLPRTEAEAPPPPPKNGANLDTAPSKDALPIAKQIEQATVLIINDSTAGLQTGSGFFIAPGIILTNAHVAQGNTDKIYVVGEFQELITKARVLAISKKKGRDYAVLQVTIKSISPLQFNQDVAKTQKISAWGFPGAVTGADPNFRALLKGQAVSAPEVVYSEGSVSVVQEQDPPLIFHTAVVSHGNSGGPLVNAQGEVVGINTYISMDNQSYRQSSLAIVSKDIIAFLNEHNIPYSIAPKE